MTQHLHDQHTDCNPSCPAYLTPYEALVQGSDTDVEHLRLVAEQDQAEAQHEVEDREATGWRLHVESHEAATFHNNTLAAKHAALASVYQATSEAIQVATTIGMALGVLRVIRKVLGR